MLLLNQKLFLDHTTDDNPPFPSTHPKKPQKPKLKEKRGHSPHLINSALHRHSVVNRVRTAVVS